MTKQDIKFILDQEIEWSKENFNKVDGEDEFKAGFVAGLQQALLLLVKFGPID